MIRQTPGGRRIPINIVGSSTFGRYNKISSEVTYNMFISDSWLVNFAGYKRVYDLLPSGEGRGFFHSIRGGFLIAVVNAIVYRINANLSPTIIGILNTSSGEVFIDENLSNQICLVDGVNAYIYNHSLPPNLTVQDLSFSTGLIPNYVCYHNTFFLFGNGNITSAGSAWYAYGFNDDNTIVQVTQLALQTKPDYALAIVRIPGQSNNVLVLGSAVSEIWTQVGGIQNYSRNSTLSIDYGCVSVSTIATSDRYVAWLGANENNAPVIMVYSGQGPTPISTDGIDFVLSKIKFPEQSTAMFYRQDGHLFYQLTFYNPQDNVTFAYDFNNEMFFNLSDPHLNYHPARNFVYFNGKTYFISLNNASIYWSSTELTVDDENIVTNTSANYDDSLVSDIQRIRVCESIREDDSSRFIANSFAVTIEQGNDENVTLLSLLNYEDDMITESLPFVPPEDEIITENGVQVVDEDSYFGAAIANNPPYQPRVDLSLSRDGGITWGNTVSRELNTVGYRQNMLTWEKMGAANDLTIKVRFWGLSRFVVNQGMLDIY